jgi:hypothetical protein
MAYFGLSHPRNTPTILGLVSALQPDSILDIGCGGGNYGSLLRTWRPDARIVGLDAWADNRNPLWECYDEVVIADARTYEYPKFGLYLLVDVIEHMDMDEGKALLRRIPGLCLVCTPRHWPQAADENPYTAHRSEWSEDDLREVIHGGKFAYDMSDDEFVIVVL